MPALKQNKAHKAKRSKTKKNNSAVVGLPNSYTFTKFVAVVAALLVATVGYTTLRLSYASTPTGYPIIGIAGKCLDNQDGRKVDYNKIQLYACNGNANQAWTVNTKGAITNSNGYCLDVYHSGTASGTHVDLFQCNGGLAQQWVVNTTAKTIINPHSNLCLDDWHSGTANGTQIDVYKCNGGLAQKWTPTPPASPFVTRSGTNLMLNGKTWRFIGFDAYGMEGCWNGTSGTPWTTAQIDAYFAGLPANGLTRIWAPESYGTASVSNILTEAAKYGQHVILSLGNDDGACDPTMDDPNQAGEPLSFYQSTWKTQYVSWVNTIVPMFKNNTTIAMWEIANESGENASVPESTMQTYLSGAAAAIKADDPSHLVESGVNYAGNMNAQTKGTAADYQNAQSSPNIDVLSFHDYAYDYEGKATLSANFTVAQAAAKALNKPFIAGEAGVEAGTGCTLTPAQRATYLLTNKTTDYFSGIGPSGQGQPDISGVMFWDYEPTSAPSCTMYDYDITPGDPLISAVTHYAVP